MAIRASGAGVFLMDSFLSVRGSYICLQCYPINRCIWHLNTCFITGLISACSNLLVCLLNKMAITGKGCVRQEEINHPIACRITAKSFSQAIARETCLFKCVEGKKLSGHAGFCSVLTGF